VYEQPGAPRTLLVTGRGGAGRTTVAAATALACASRHGLRTLLLSAEEPGVLGEVLGLGPGGADSRRGHGGSPATADEAGPPDGAEAESCAGRPVPGVPRLRVARVDSAARFRRAAADLQERARSALDLLGGEPLDEDEMTELPGADELALLHALRAAHESGRWDAVVADLPPSRSALPMLALPERLRRWLRRLAPPERRAARALRPVLAQLAGVPMPAAGLYDAVARWDRQLAAVQRVVESPGTAVRLVAEPGPLAAEALRTDRAGLCLYGLRLESLVANRLLPTDAADGWPAALSGRQQSALKELREEYGPCGRGECEAAPGGPLRFAPYGAPLVHELPHLGRDPRGTDDLAELAAAVDLAGWVVPERQQPAGAAPGLSAGEPAPVRTPSRSSGAHGPGADARAHFPYAEADFASADAGSGAAGPGGAGGAGGRPEPVLGSLDDRLPEDGLLVWRLPLPGARTAELDLLRRGDELIVTVGPHRRALPLPSVLRRCRVVGAGLEAGELSVRCVPDEDLWPVGRPRGRAE